MEETNGQESRMPDILKNPFCGENVFAFAFAFAMAGPQMTSSFVQVTIASFDGRKGLKDDCCDRHIFGDCVDLTTGPSSLSTGVDSSVCSISPFRCLLRTMKTKIEDRIKNTPKPPPTAMPTISPRVRVADPISVPVPTGCLRRIEASPAGVVTSIS